MTHECTNLGYEHERESSEIMYVSLHDFKVCTNTWWTTFTLFLSQLESGYKPHMLVKDSHLKDYDKIIIRKRSVIAYGDSHTHIIHICGCIIFYHSLTLIVQLVSDCHTQCLGSVTFSIVCLLGCEARGTYSPE